MKCHIHLKENRDGVSCGEDTDSACHACRQQLQEPKFRRKKKYLTKDRNKKRAKRKPDKTSTDVLRPSWDQSDTDSGMW